MEFKKISQVMQKKIIKQKRECDEQKINSKIDVKSTISII